jgi:hypothetical protein
MICVIYVDDTVFAEPDELKIAEEIAGLVVSKYETQHNFQLRDEGEVRDSLSIQIANEGEGTFLLTQTGLIDNVLKTAGLEDNNLYCTSEAMNPSGADTKGDDFVETIEFACVLGMLMYLDAIMQHDIFYAAQQAARHIHTFEGRLW